MPSFEVDQNKCGAMKKHAALRAVAAAMSFLAVCCPIGGVAIAQSDSGTSKVADAWIGRPASELLRQWPVDRGLSTAENEETGETAYSYNFGIPAHVESIYDGTDQYQSGDGMHITHYYHDENVPDQWQCTITFWANDQGVIARYQYDGVKCRPFAQEWGRPKGR